MDKKRTRARRNPTLRRKRASRFVRFIRISLLASALCGALVLACATVGKVARPYVIGHQEAKDIEQINREIRSLKTENKALRKEIGYLSTPAGAEAEARKLGWVKEGEVLVVVEQPDKTKAGQMETSDSDAGGSIWQRAVRTVRHLLGMKSGPRER